jgi:hypothetical protein
MLLKRKGDNRYVVGGRWYVGNGKQGPAAGAWGRKPANRRRVPAPPAQFVLQLKKAYQP